MTDIDPNNPLRAYFENNPGRLIDKWLHYFDVYHRYLAQFRGTACTLVEIGVFHGGSLQMWRNYLGPQARIVGVDINPRVQAFAEPGIEIVIGDQSNRQFLKQLRAHVPSIDILIDDGGHKMQQQIVTLDELYPALQPHGVYIAEDLHTSYWRDYGGGYRNPYSFIELAKGLIDQLNAWHSRDPHSFVATDFTRTTGGLHFYDSMLVVEKQPRGTPMEKTTGKAAFAE